MLILFVRTVFLYLFLLLILRLTGKRQVADLEPFDLIVTLVIADVGSNAISDADTPLLYSVVPIIGLYLVQQAIAKLALKSDGARRFLCGTPQLLIHRGVLDEAVMRRTNYTILDVIDHLREKDVFNLDEVEDAILETNGSISVRKKPAFVPPDRIELSVPIENEEAPQLLIREGRYFRQGMRDAKLTEETLNALLSARRLTPKDVFLMQRTTDGRLHVQLFHARGGKVLSLAAPK